MILEQTMKLIMTIKTPSQRTETQVHDPKWQHQHQQLPFIALRRTNPDLKKSSFGFSSVSSWYLYFCPTCTWATSTSAASYFSLKSCYFVNLSKFDTIPSSISSRRRYPYSGRRSGCGSGRPFFSRIQILSSM